LKVTCRRHLTTVRNMATFMRVAVVGWLLAGAAAAMAHERFVAVETGAVLSPRQYHMSPALPLLKRQNGCDPGSHPCLCPPLHALGQDMH
jgi:hypothetical protein